MIQCAQYSTVTDTDTATIIIVDICYCLLGMVILGYDTTQPVTMEDMLHHTKAVRRGAKTRFIVADMPFGSYESGHEKRVYLV